MEVVKDCLSCHISEQDYSKLVASFQSTVMHQKESVLELFQFIMYAGMYSLHLLVLTAIRTSRSRFILKQI